MHDGSDIRLNTRQGRLAGLCWRHDDAPRVLALHGWLFGEDQARYLLAVAPASEHEVLDSAHTAGVVARVIGRTGGDALTLGTAPAISLESLRSRAEGWLPTYMNGG